MEATKLCEQRNLAKSWKKVGNVTGWEWGVTSFFCVNLGFNNDNNFDGCVAGCDCFGLGNVL
jgi:hypothetical protein